jgi:uncharacterized protein (TIGR02996 family)
MPTTADLFLQVYSSPGDEAARQVLADRLLEDGDPRGEFIALQLRRSRGSLPPSGVKREKRLLAEHELTWLAPIRRLLIGDTTVWRDGFLDACGATLDGSTVGALEWSTVRKLTLYLKDRDRPEELARDFPSLTELDRANTHALDVLVKASQKAPIATLSYSGPTRSLREWVPRQLDALLELAELPHLKRLKLTPATAVDLTGRDFGFFFDSALARKLEHLTLTLVRAANRARPEAPFDLASFVRAAEPLALKTLEVELQALASYRFERKGGAFSQLAVRALTPPSMTGSRLPVMMQSLRGLDPKALERLEVIYPGKRLARRHLFAVEDTAKRFSRVGAVEYRAAT